MISLRPYQRECVEVVNALEGGSHLVHMATGLGKTVVFSSLERKGRVLVLSHRDELVRQPVKFYEAQGCRVGIEKGEETSDGEEVVSATVQTLSRKKRLSRFRKGDFDMVITDEAHHALAPSYRRIVDALQPRIHLGFTATPRRGDDRGLKDVFDDIVFSRDLKWGVENGWLADIDCRRVYVDWDTSRLRKKNGDWAVSDLDAEVNRPTTNAQVARAYEEFAEGSTLVFAASVTHAHELATMMEGSAVVDGRMPMEERRAVLRAFEEGEVGCLINYGVFTEGTDLPMIRTVLLARPTQNPTLYAQMVGRGLRIDESRGKKSVRLIDCVGATRDNRLCTAPTLFGLNESDFPEKADRVLDGSLLGLEARLKELEDTPHGWVLRARKVNLLGEAVAWITKFDGTKSITAKDFSVTKSAPDDLGRVRVVFSGENVTEREFDSSKEADAAVRGWLERNPLTRFARRIWDPEEVSRWADLPATASQIDYANKLVEELSGDDLRAMRLSRRDAAILIENAKAREESKRAERIGACPVCGAPLKLSASGKMVMCTRISWQKKRGKLVPTGPCRFRFIRRVNGRRLSERQVKTLVEKGRLLTAGRVVSLALEDDDEYKIVEVR